MQGSEEGRNNSVVECSSLTKKEVNASLRGGGAIIML